MKRILSIILAVVLAALCYGCGKKTPEPAVYKTYETAHMELFDLQLRLACGYYHTPDPGAGKTVLTMMVDMTYTGKEGVAFALGKTEEQPYIRFMIHYGDGYVFEEYKVVGRVKDEPMKGLSCMMDPGYVATDLTYLHFEPMEAAHPIQLWMFVPEEVLENKQDGLYLAVEVNGDIIRYDIGGEIDWEGLYMA